MRNSRRKNDQYRMRPLWPLNKPERDHLPGVRIRRAWSYRCAAVGGRRHEDRQWFAGARLGCEWERSRVKLKTFKGTTWDGVEVLQDSVNRWLAAERPDVVKTETTACSIGCSEELYQFVLISIWYEPAPKP